MSQKFHCIHCGDAFRLSSEDYELFIEGFLSTPDTCPECQYNLDFPEYSFPNYSDADAGL